MSDFKLMWDYGARELTFWATISHGWKKSDFFPFDVYADKIVSVNVTKSLFNNDYYSVGGVCSQKLELEIFTDDANFVPRAAAIKLYARLIDGLNYGDKDIGTFYTTYRTYNKDTHVLRITAYDIALKTEELIYNGTTFDKGTRQTIDGVVYTKTTAETVYKRIVADIGDDYLQADASAASLLRNYELLYPYTADLEFDARSALSQIAGITLGNWVVGSDNVLSLIRFNTTPNITSLLVDENGDYIDFGGVHLIV